jgi:membrane-bound lytic murein transglycosylase B
MVGVVVALVTASGAAARADERGWSFLIEKLVHDGIPRDRALRVFRDDRVDEFDGLQFSLQPRESSALYRDLHTRRTAGLARQCRERYEGAFDEAERRFGVPSQVVAAIIQVESGCGANTGHSRIMPALARLAMAAEPDNVDRNIARLTLMNPKLPVASFTRWRAQHLEDTFYPQVKATFEIADRLRIDPLDIRGSGSGAFGIPQFLPQSYLLYGVDGDADGQVSLYDPGDAIPSCANYLKEYGWRSGLSRKEQRNVIWGYNHSDAYIDTVLWIADEVKAPTPEPAAPKKRVRLAKGKHTRAKSTRATSKSTHATSKSTHAASKRRARK